ncbi:hypothetical protein [Okeania sp. SIO2B3]|uniref:hypothetical protein n=1 Tax=Okeania sp. SIO2B3 TaxID=2607784 RepID=UPI0013C25FAD|nr:hypothetical protein [Okeania sp. SIO2B3]NET40579.1 hypothetical protein [Okeania sp. SIO2B3]
MLDRISEPISSFFSARIDSSTDITIIDFSAETNYYKSIISGSDYNFNYALDYLTASYLLPSLIEKPYREYKGITQAQRTAEDVEFSREYNELTFDERIEKYYAIRLVLTIIDNSLNIPFGEILLYNSLTRLNQPLLQYLGTPIVGDSCTLKAKAINIKPLESDSLIISGSYRGSVNYTFDNGNHSLVFP